jgi:hypothetical protein
MRYFTFLALLSPLLATAEPVGNPEAAPVGRGFSPKANIPALLKTLSPSARKSAVFPDDDEWANATTRWSGYPRPNFQMVISPSTVNDVEKIVQFASRHSIPLHPSTSTHGVAVSLRQLTNAIQLNLRPGFTQIKRINHDTIEVGGGVKNHEMVDYLYENKLRVSTGGCDCVGFFGLALGGGLGKYSGVTGLVTDTLKSVEIVLPSSGKLTTASETKNKDLFWGIRGIGHNLGVALSARVKVIPVDPETDSNEWINASYLYTIDHLTELIEYIEYWRNNIQPPQMTLFIFIFPPAEWWDPLRPTINLSFQYFGPRSTDDTVFAPFEALGPYRATRNLVPWNGIATATGIGINDPACQKDPSSAGGTFSAQISHLSPAAFQDVFNFLNNTAWPVSQENPNWSTSAVWEVYPQQGVRKTADAETAYPWRHKPITAAFSTRFPSNVTAAEEERLRELGEQGRALINKAEEDLGVYVNYAHGDEGAEAQYGRGARLQKVLALKKKYDPKGILSGYNPVEK